MLIRTAKSRENRKVNFKKRRWNAFSGIKKVILLCISVPARLIIAGMNTFTSTIFFFLILAFVQSKIGKDFNTIFQVDVRNHLLCNQRKYNQYQE